MTTLAIRLKDEMVYAIDANAGKLHLTRNAYIKQAIIKMNLELQIQERTQKLISASHRVRNESMAVNSEFSFIEYGPEA
jgi:predicted transcriptional regulator